MSTSVETDPSVYSLVFSGLRDDSPEALQKLKGIFIADLDFSVPEVQAILESGSAVLCATENESDIEAKYAVLKEAGAEVHIVAPTLVSESVQDEGEESNQDEVTEQAEVNEADTFDADESDSDEFELELSFDEVFEEPEKPKKKRTTTHVLDDQSLSLDDAMSELGIEPSESVEQELSGGIDKNISSDDLTINMSDEVSNDILGHEESDLSELQLDSRATVESEEPGHLQEEPVPSVEVPENQADSSSVSAPKVNDRGVIPADQIVSDAPLFELTDMADTVADGSNKQSVSDSPLPDINNQQAESSDDALFADLSLQPEAEENDLIDSTSQYTAVTEDIDLSLKPLSDIDPDSEEETLGFTESEVKPSPVEEKQSSKESAANELFGDLDAMMDDVADTVSADLKQAGIEFESSVEPEKTEEVLGVQQSDLEPEALVSESRVVAEPVEKSPEPVTEDKVESESKPSTLGSVKNVKAEREVDQELEDKPKRQSRIPVDVFFGVLIGVIVLGLGNWFYFQGSTVDNELEQERIRLELLKIQKEEKLKKKKEKAAASKAEKKISYTNTYTGKMKDNGISSSAVAVLDEGKLEVTEFILRGPKPKPLTDKEIVEGIEQRPQLTKVVIEPGSIELDEENSGSAKFQTKVFVLHKSTSERFGGEGIVDVQAFPDKRSMKLTLKAYSADSEPVEPRAAKITSTKDGEYSYSIAASVDLKATVKEH